MADIKKELNDIKNAVYGREVRSSIHDGIKKINDESEESKRKAEEAHEITQDLLDETFDSSLLEANFKQRLDDEIANLQPEWTEFKNDVTSQLAENANKMDWVDVHRDFGVPNDGSDQTGLIRQAINYARDNNKTLYFPAGVYKGAFELYSNMRVVGENPTLTKIILPPVFYKGISSVGAWGTEEEPLNNITVENITFESPYDFRPQFRWVKNLTLNNVRCVGDAHVRLDNVEFYRINDAHMFDTRIGISLYGCNYGMLSNTTADMAGEVIDFWNCDSATIDGINATAKISLDGEELNRDEVVDIGASKNIIVKNINAYGYWNGITLKNEAMGHGLKNIIVSDCNFNNVRNRVIRLTFKGGMHGSHEDNGNITFRNINGNSEEVNSRGITIDREDEDAKPFGVITIDNCNLYTDSTALRFGGDSNQDYNLKGGRVVVSDTVAHSRSASGLYSRRSDNIVLKGRNDIKGGSGQPATRFVETTGINIINAYLHDSFNAIHTMNCSDINIFGGNFENLESDVINMIINSPLPSTKLITMVGTKIGDFGAGHDNRYIINATISDTESDYHTIKIKDNVTDNHISRGHKGYHFNRHGSKTIKNVMIKDNQSQGLDDLLSSLGESKFDEATTIVKDNITI